MTHPRFTCRREGHQPQATVTSNPAGREGTYLTLCKRCGQTLELPLPNPAPTTLAPACF